MNDYEKYNIRYAKSISWTVIQDEVFVFDEKTDDVYVLRGLSEKLWLLLDEVHTINNLVKVSASGMDTQVPFLKLKTNILRVLNSYSEKGWITYNT